jgi:DNA-directed RNA polymerase specialized sigma24 family protein
MTAPSSERIPCGDRDAEFSRFYRGSFARLVGRCVFIGVPAADAPGVVQGLMLEIYRRWAEIRSAEAYADSAVACRAADYLKLSSRTVASDDADLARLGQPLTADLPDGVLHVEGEHLVLEALSRLPPQQRAVFALVYDDYSIADIAAALKLTQVTTRSHLRHARATLRTWWSGRTTEDHERGRP